MPPRTPKSERQKANKEKEKDTVASDGARAADPPLPGSPWAQVPAGDDYPKVPDPVDKKRMVSTKQANRPFLAWVISFRVNLLPF